MHSVAYTIMGNDCYIYAGARIGQDGFGFQVMNGKHQRIPQVGRVIIGNDVEIGANACVDRGLWMIRLSVTAAGLIIWFKSLITTSLAGMWWLLKPVSPEAVLSEIMSFVAGKQVLLII